MIDLVSQNGAYLLFILGMVIFILGKIIRYAGKKRDVSVSDILSIPGDSHKHPEKYYKPKAILISNRIIIFGLTILLLGILIAVLIALRIL